jgi:predicted AlkP superfamily phosphohydrolase/phosphomutase
MSDEVRPKVAMIGMDAAELSFIRGNLAVLPALRRILETGTLHRLGSTAGAFPGSVWPTLYSGTLPGEHGIYHHLQWDPEAMRLRRVADDWLYVEPFWYELERRGLRVATIDVPMTFPSRLAGGAEIINWGSHDELGPFHARPRHLSADIRRLFGRHPMGSEIPIRKSPGQLELIQRSLVAGVRLKSELSRWLLAQSDWDFYLTVFGETHRGGHLLWPEHGAENSGGSAWLLDVYRAVDRAVGELLDALPHDVTTLIVFALHGMGRNTSQEHFMPKVIDRVNTRFMADADRPTAGGARESRASQRSAMRFLRERLPAGLQNAVARAVPVAVRDRVVSRQISAGHDWRRTPGIALLADLNGYLRWNVQGREGKGMLGAGGERLERYVEWVTRCMNGLRAPGAEGPLVREVLLTPDHYTGGRTSLLPDAVVTWTGLPPVSRIHSEEIGALAAELGTGRAGNHLPDGFCVVIDRGVGRGQAVRPPSHISELATFVSSLLGPRPEEPRQRRSGTKPA